jgi:hypothetical protein
MPTFIRPQSVTVVEGGSGFPWELAAGLLAAAAVAVFVLAHLAVLAIGLPSVAAVTGVAVQFLRRYMVLDFAPRRVRAAVALQAVAAAQRPAIEAPALHIHIHGLAPEDVAAVIRQQVAPAWPAIEED